MFEPIIIRSQAFIFVDFYGEALLARKSRACRSLSYWFPIDAREQNTGNAAHDENSREMVVLIRFYRVLFIMICCVLFSRNDTLTNLALCFVKHSNWQVGKSFYAHNLVGIVQLGETNTKKREHIGSGFAFLFSQCFIHM